MVKNLTSCSIGRCRYRASSNEPGRYVWKYVEMKLLLSTRHIDEAERAKILLESKGIPAFISNKYQNNVRRYFPKLLGVWVYLNEQETEALKVLENPEYEVMEPIDTNEFYRQLPEKEVGALARAQLLKWLFASLISVVLIAGILGVLIKN